MTKKKLIVLIVLLLLVGGVSGVVAVTMGGEAPPPAPTVALVEVVRGDVQTEREGFAAPVLEPSRVEAGATLHTEANARATLRLDRGGWLLLDRSTEVTATLDTLTLGSGRVWVDATRSEEITFDTGFGTLTADGATFALASTENEITVYCSSGEVTYVSEHGSGRLAQGETLALSGSAAEVEPAELWDDWTGGLADPTPRPPTDTPYVGKLVGRRLDQLGMARTPLPVRAHEVDVRVSGDLAVTEVTQTFFNARSDMLETEYRVRIPETAVVQGFEVDLGAGFVASDVQAQRTESGYQSTWAEPAQATSRLVYDGPGRLRARVNPVAPGATVRVKIRYTEWLEREGSMRTYVYPMDEGGTAPLIGELVLRVSTDGQVGAFRAGLGARVEAGQVVFRASDYRPRADFYLDLIDREDLERAPGARVYEMAVPRVGEAAEGDESFVLFDIPTDELVEVDSDAERPAPALVILLDVSGATEPEDLELARGTVEAVLRQLAPEDQVTLRVADVTAHRPEGVPEGLLPANDETRETLLGALSRVQLGGATDLAASLRGAAQLVDDAPRGAVLYIGDGLPTTGALDATSIHRSLAALANPPRFFAFAVGDGANLDLLRALFDENAVAVRERPEATRAVLSMLAELGRLVLRDVHVDLGPSVERVYPRGALTVPVGQNLRVVGRLRDDVPTTLSVRGQLLGEAFSAEMPAMATPLDDEGDIRRRWGMARVAELIDEDAGREALVELGTRFKLLTPWTSFVVGAAAASDWAVAETYHPVRGFDHDPYETAWSLGGRGPRLTTGALGWRRRQRRSESDVSLAPESTWVERVVAVPEAPAASAGGGDGGLGYAAVTRAIRRGTRGPNGCYERKLLVAPHLQGSMRVQVEVDGTGLVHAATSLHSNLGAPDVVACVLSEVRGIRYPATGSSQRVTVTHTYSFQSGGRALGSRRSCSDASRQPLSTRRALWRERLAANAGSAGAVSVYRQALRQCELSNWRARRSLLDMALRHVGGTRQQIGLYRALSGDGVRSYLRRAILRRARTPQEVQIVRRELGLEVAVDWVFFSRLWKRNDNAERRLALVRRWLEVLTDDLDLRLRLMRLLEETDAMPEARRVARALRADPLADAKVRTAVGEFWLRQGDMAEGRRVFSEIVERAPLDPWARRRLGDLYRAHGWSDDAYREYQSLARLRPGDASVLLLLARAAADSGRIDEALRLEQRLGESVDPDVTRGAPGVARLWSLVRLARLDLDVTDAATRAALRRRKRSTGALREPPAVFAALTWSHPDDAPQLFARLPSTPEEVEWERASVLGGMFGLEALRLREREEGPILFEVRRLDEDDLRDTTAELLVVLDAGTDEERVLRHEITLSRSERKRRFRLLDDGTLEPTAVPAADR